MKRWNPWKFKYLSWRPHRKSLAELSVPNLIDLYNLSVVCNHFTSEHSQEEETFYQNTLPTVTTELVLVLIAIYSLFWVHP